MITDLDKITGILINASGISNQQAKTCLYYAISTHMVPDRLNLIPILVIIGAMGTGKTKLLEQLRTLVNTPKLIGAESSATLRDSLSNTITALIDEGDKVDERYLQRRYSKETSQITHNVAGQQGKWLKVDSDIFGATIIVRRTPFEDPATKSRAIAIHTKYREGKYEIVDGPMEVLVEIAKSTLLDDKPSHRINDNWQALQAIAKAVGDDDWLNYCRSEIEKDIHAMMASQDFEPEEAVLAALREQMMVLTTEGQVVYQADPLISDIKSVLKQHYDLNLRSYQIKELCVGMGFRVVTTNNYPKVKANGELVEKLMQAKGLHKENEEMN